MWTDGNRAEYNRDKRRYPSGVTDEEGAKQALQAKIAEGHVEPLIPPAKRGGRKREANMREVFDGVIYVPGTGSQWRGIPKDLPPKGTLYRYFCDGAWDGVPDRIHDALYVKCREQAGREASPAAAVIGGKTREKRRTLRQAQEGGAHRSARLSRGQSFGELRRSRARSATFPPIRKACRSAPSFIAPAFGIAAAASCCFRRCPAAFPFSKNCSPAARIKGRSSPARSPAFRLVQRPRSSNAAIRRKAS